MTEHEKSRKHYEQSGTYDPNMEYFEECEVNSGAWVLIIRQIPVDERCKPHLFGIFRFAIFRIKRFLRSASQYSGRDIEKERR